MTAAVVDLLAAVVGGAVGGLLVALAAGWFR